MCLENTTQQILHEFAGALLVGALPSDHLVISPGRLAERAVGRKRQHRRQHQGH
jgi:hypothetical protein